MNNLKKQLNLTSQAQQTARTLIEQQMWCWGCDVRRSDGNLLMQYGAQKRPSPNPRYHSAYTFQLAEETILTLWGWGLWIASPQHGSLFLGRSRLQMSYMRDVVLMPNAWCRNDLSLATLTLDDDDLVHAQQLLTTAMCWIGDYEAWLKSEVAPDYRENALANWPQRKRHKGGIPASEMAESWFALSHSIVN